MPQADGSGQGRGFAPSPLPGLICLACAPSPPWPVLPLPWSTPSLPFPTLFHPLGRAYLLWQAFSALPEHIGRLTSTPAPCTASKHACLCKEQFLALGTKVYLFCSGLLPLPVDMGGRQRFCRFGFLNMQNITTGISVSPGENKSTEAMPEKKFTFCFQSSPTQLPTKILTKHAHLLTNPR